MKPFFSQCLDVARCRLFCHYFVFCCSTWALPLYPSRSHSISVDFHSRCTVYFFSLLTIFWAHFHYIVAFLHNIDMFIQYNNAMKNKSKQITRNRISLHILVDFISSSMLFLRKLFLEFVSHFNRYTSSSTSTKSCTELQFSPPFFFLSCFVLFSLLFWFRFVCNVAYRAKEKKMMRKASKRQI